MKTNAAPKTSKPARGAMAGGRQSTRGGVAGQQAQARKRSNGAVILHHLEQMGEMPPKQPVASAPAITSRQVHYPTLPKSLLNEDALKALLTPFGKILSVDMQYAGRGALVTFANANSAQKAMTGAMLPNGKVLSGTHPTPINPQITKKGRNFQNGLQDGLMPALGRHNMEDEELDEVKPQIPKKTAIKAEERSNRKQSQFAPSAADDDDDQELETVIPTTKKRKNEVTKELPTLQRHNANYMKMALTQHTPILQKARSNTSKWVSTSTKKTIPTTFTRFGTVSNAMDVDPDASVSDNDEAGDDFNASSPVGRFSSYDPTTKRQSLEPGVIEGPTLSNAAPGRPSAVDPALIRKISAKLQEEEQNGDEQAEEDDWESGGENDENDENGDHHDAHGSSRKPLFSHVSNGDDEGDWSDHNESDDDNTDGEKDSDEEAPDEENEEAMEDENDQSASVESDDGEEADDGHESDAEETEERETVSSSFPVPSAPLRPLVPELKRPAPMAFKPSPSPAKSQPMRYTGTIESLSRVLNPQSNLGCLNALYDAGKHIWHTNIERNDPQRAVSSFQRPAGGDDIPPPERVRPVSYLYSALSVIEQNGEDALASGAVTRLEWYNYALNRYRQVLKELTQQSTMCLLSCYVAEVIARRALSMKAELMMEEGVEPDEAFDTGREKVLDNAFEMCKNIYTFYTQRDMKSPFATEIMSYYLLYRLRDGPKTSLPTLLDSLASVFLSYRENTTRSTSKSIKLAELRFDSNIDLVCKIIENFNANHWSAIRLLCNKTSYLHLCSIADLMPDFVYYALPMCFQAFRDTKGAKVALPASYLQYHFFLRADRFIHRMKEMGIGENIEYNDGIHLEIAPEKQDLFYPLPAPAAFTPRRSKSKASPSFLPPDVLFWGENKDQIMKLLSLLPPTFLYSTTAEPGIHSINALKVYLRWASKNLFQDNNQEPDRPFDISEFPGEDDFLDAPPLKKDAYVIPSNLFTAASIYQTAIEQSLALNGVPSESLVPAIKPLKSAAAMDISPKILPQAQPKAKLPPPPPMKKSNPLAAVQVSVTAPAAVIKKPADVHSAPKVPYQSANTHMEVEIEETKEAPPHQPMARILPSSSRMESSSSPPPTISSITEVQIAAIKEELQKQMKDQTDAIVAAFAQREQQMLGQIEALRHAEQELTKFTEETAQRQAYLQKHAEPSFSLPVASTPLSKRSKKFTSPILALNLPQLVGPHVAHCNIEEMMQKSTPALLTFKLLVNLSDALEPESGTVEYWLCKKLSLTHQGGSVDRVPGSEVLDASVASALHSRHVVTLTCTKSQVDLSMSNPFNMDLDWIPELGLKQTSYPSLATVVKSISTAEVTPEDYPTLSQTLRATQGVLFYLPFNLSAFESEEAFWDHHRSRLQRTLYFLSGWCRISLMVLYGPELPHFLANEENARVSIQTNLDLASLIESKCSHALVLRLSGNQDAPLDLNKPLDAARATEQLEHIFSSFAMLSRDNAPIRASSLSQMLQAPTEKMINGAYQRYRHQIDMAKQNKILAPISDPLVAMDDLHVPLPSDFIQTWNSMLEELANTIRVDSLAQIDWPAPETCLLFPQAQSVHHWPPLLWNSEARFEALTHRLSSMVIMEPKPMESATFDISLVEDYIGSLLANNPHLQAFSDEAGALVVHFQEQLAAAQAVARKTDYLPVKIPFSWHCFFEPLFEFLLRDLNDQVGYFSEAVPTKEALSSIQGRSRDRFLSEADSWISWYQSLCPSVEVAKKRALEERQPQSAHSSSFADALLSQFSPSPSAAFRPITAPIPAYSSPFSASCSHTLQSALQEPTRPLDLGTPKRLQFSKLDASTASPSRSNAANTPVSSTSNVDALQERLKSLQARISRIHSNGDIPLAARQTNPKRKAADEGYLIDAPTPSRRKFDDQ
jgi:hypothetical protein